MTPKEKATELFYKFNSFNTYGLDKECCKKSALFLVDEIIKSNPTKGHSYDNIDRVNEGIEFWNKVKEEIQSI